MNGPSEQQVQLVESSAEDIRNIKLSPECEPIDWTPQHDAILASWKAKCFVYMWLQNASSYYFSFMNNLLCYPVIILSSCTSATVFSVQVAQGFYMKYILGVISLLSALLMAIIRQMKPDEMNNSYSTTTRKYQIVIRKIDIMLDLSFSMRRENPEVFIERLNSEIDGISQLQLMPPSNVIKRFEKRFGNLHEILYGQDIIELLKRDMQHKKAIRKQLKTIDGAGKLGLAMTSGGKSSCNIPCIPCIDVCSKESIVTVQMDKLDKKSSTHALHTT